MDSGTAPRERRQDFNVEAGRTQAAPGHEGVYLDTFDQCRYGCMAEKKTDLLSNIPGLTQFQLLCKHEVQRWVIPWSGKLVIAHHQCHLDAGPPQPGGEPAG